MKSLTLIITLLLVISIIFNVVLLQSQETTTPEDDGGIVIDIPPQLPDDPTVDDPIDEDPQNPILEQEDRTALAITLIESCQVVSAFIGPGTVRLDLMNGERYEFRQTNENAILEAAQNAETLCGTRVPVAIY